jgi:hypothetical protein
MYLLDNDQVPYSSHFSKKECACLAIAMKDTRQLETESLGLGWFRVVNLILGLF